MENIDEIMSKLQTYSQHIADINERGVIYTTDKSFRRGNSRAAGIDITASETVTINPGEYKKVPNKLKTIIPEGYHGTIAPRSSIGIKGVVNLAGVIDNDYRGEMGVFLANLSNKPITINEGDRYAQLVMHVQPELNIKYINEEEFQEKVDKEKNNSRKEGGFGSTGK